MMDPLLDADEDATPPDEQQQQQQQHITVLAHEHRVDWSQSDESGRRPRLLLSPLLRKADSLWGLRTRLGSKASASSASGGGPPLGGIQEQEHRVSEGSGSGSGLSGSREEDITTAVAAAPASVPPPLLSAKTPKSPKSSFFAKFKR